MVFFVPIWLVVLLYAFRVLRIVLRVVLAALLEVVAWLVLLVVAIFVHGYRTGRQMMDPLYRTRQQIRDLPEAGQ